MINSLRFHLHNQFITVTFQNVICAKRKRKSFAENYVSFTRIKQSLQLLLQKKKKEIKGKTR